LKKKTHPTPATFFFFPPLLFAFLELAVEVLAFFAGVFFFDDEAVEARPFPFPWVLALAETVEV